MQARSTRGLDIETVHMIKGLGQRMMEMKRMKEDNKKNQAWEQEMDEVRTKRSQLQEELRQAFSSLDQNRTSQWLVESAASLGLGGSLGFLRAFARHRRLGGERRALFPERRRLQRGALGRFRLAVEVLEREL